MKTENTTDYGLYNKNLRQVKSSRNKKDLNDTASCTNVLNDVTAAPFSVSFSQLPAAKKTPKTGQL